jgi:hypothetical protein
MTDKHDELAGLQQDLKTKGLSRRNFLDRVKALGLGFGAAGAVGGAAAARDVTDKAVTLKSTNPAVDNIVTEGREELKNQPAQGPQLAQRYFFRYRRFFFRRYRRFFFRYRRFRFYRRFFYRRFF